MIKYIFYYISICFIAILLLALCGCTSTTRTQTQIALNEISVIERQITSIQDKLPEECKTLLYDDLILVKNDLNNTKKSIEQINESCNQEKSLLKSQNRVKNFWIIMLLAIVGFLLYNQIKRGS